MNGAWMTQSSRALELTDGQGAARVCRYLFELKGTGYGFTASA
jgi:hypothetical protein